LSYKPKRFFDFGRNFISHPIDFVKSRRDFSSSKNTFGHS